VPDGAASNIKDRVAGCRCSRVLSIAINPHRQIKGRCLPAPPFTIRSGSRLDLDPLWLLLQLGRLRHGDGQDAVLEGRLDLVRLDRIGEP
jgi:hypothetical protein